MNNKFFIHLKQLLLGLILAFFSVGNIQAQKMKKFEGERRTEAYYIRAYLDSAQLLTNKAPLRAIDHINKAIELSIRNNDKTNEALSYCILGNIQQNLGQHDLAIDNYEKCITAVSFKSGYSMSSNSINSNSARNMNSIPKAKKNEKYVEMDADTKSIQLIPDQSLFTAYKRMAFSLLQLNRLAEANTAISSCFEAEFSSITSSERLDAKRIQANIFLKQGKLDESLGLLLNTLEEEKRQGTPDGEIKTLMAIASLYQQTKREARAIDYYQQAKNLSDKINNTELSLSINNSMAQIFRQQKNINKELETRSNSIELANSVIKKDASDDVNSAATNSQKEIISLGYSSATMMYDKKLEQDEIALPLFSKSEDLEYTANTYKLLAEQYLKEGNSTKALAYLNIFAKIQDSIKNTRKRELAEALKISNALGKNQQRIDLLEKERNLSERSIEVLQQDRKLKDSALLTRNIIIGTLLFLIVFMLGSGYYLLKNFREKRRVNQLLAIKSLRGQMNPHFIFNALNSVNHYISQNDELAANKYLSDFSKLMRAVMETSKQDLITLTEELDILKIYLQLEHSRFKDKFDYTFNVDNSIDTSEVELPPMIIQPFIENAVWHGLRYRDEKGMLNIDIQQKNNQLQLVVSDNGIGRKKSIEIKTKNQKLQNSTGMQNIENRIAIMNELYKMNIQVSITDAYPDLENAGTRVEIIIPKKINTHA